MISLLQDLSNITCIPKLTLDKLNDKCELLIADSVLESYLKEEMTSSINIGIGILHIKLENGTIKYKFVPNKSLDNLISEVIKDKESPLIDLVDESLRKRIESTYKELLS